MTEAICLSDVRFSGDDPAYVQSSKDAVYSGNKATNSFLRGLNRDCAEVTAKTFPYIYNCIESVAQIVGVGNWSAFIIPEVDYQASCFVNPDDEGEVILSISGALVRDFPEANFKFVIGHEFGHSLFQHHGYPDPSEKSNIVEREALLELRRNAEYSADRVGLIACANPNAAMTSIVQLASHLPAALIGISLDDFRSQADKICVENLRTNNSFSHPPLPLRAVNLDLFSQTDVYSEHCSGAVPSMKIADCDASLFSSIGKTHGKNGGLAAPRNAELACYWAVVALFASDKKFSAPEQSWMTSRFGERLTDGAKRFMSGNGKFTTREAMKKFAQHCPHILDSKNVLISKIKKELSEASAVSSSSTELREKVFDACLQQLDSC